MLLPPDVLIFCFDALRPDHVTREIMPRLSRLIEQGLVFTGAETDSGWTNVSVSSMIYGEAVLDPQDTIGMVSIPQRLAPQYHSFAVLGQNVLCMPETDALWSTFDEVWRCAEWSGSYKWYAEHEKPIAALKRLAEATPSPWLAYVHVTPVHDPYRCEDGEYRPWDRRNPTQNAANYRSYCQWADAFYADVLQAHVDRGGLLVVVSDHGEALGEDGAFGHGDAGMNALPYVQRTLLALVGRNVSPGVSQGRVNNNRLPYIVCDAIRGGPQKDYASELAALGYVASANPAPVATMPHNIPIATLFSTPEREFLRVAAMAEPRWDVLRQLAPHTNGDVLLARGGEHQLDGVVAWRLLDERLDGVVPEDVRERCRKYLDWLGRQNRNYWEQAGAAIAFLDEGDLRYAVVGGPIQYHPLGIDAWPRRWDDIEIAVEVKSTDELELIVSDLGAVEVHRCAPDWWAVFLPDGLRIALETNLPREDGLRETAWGLAEKTDRVSILGLEMNAPMPSPYVAMAAYRTWRTVIERATRMPLWALARLKAWTGLPEFSWDAIETLLQREMSRRDSKYAGWAKTHRTTTASSRSNPATCAMWMLRMADRIYGLETPETLRALPDPEMVAWRKLPVIRGEEYYYEGLLVEWETYPGDEEFLFGEDQPDGVDARIEAGWWRAAPERFTYTYPVLVNATKEVPR